jgi:hypothetical protein
MGVAIEMREPRRDVLDKFRLGGDGPTHRLHVVDECGERIVLHRPSLGTGAPPSLFPARNGVASALRFHRTHDAENG